MSSTKMPVTSIIRVRDAELRVLIGFAFKDERGNISIHLDVTPPSGQMIIHDGDIAAPKEHAIFSPLFQYVYEQLKSHANNGLTNKQERHVVKILTDMVDRIPGFKEWMSGI